MPSVSQGVITVDCIRSNCAVLRIITGRAHRNYLLLALMREKRDREERGGEGKDEHGMSTWALLQVGTGGARTQGCVGSVGERSNADSRHQTPRLQSVVYHHFPCRSRLRPAKGRFAIHTCHQDRGEKYQQCRNTEAWFHL